MILENTFYNCLNALTGIFCFSIYHGDWTEEDDFGLNALTGIFCFSIEQWEYVNASGQASQCPHGHFLFFNDPNPELYSVNYPCLNALTGIFCFSIRQIWRIIMKTNPSQCPHGHFLFFNQDTQ